MGLKKMRKHSTTVALKKSFGGMFDRVTNTDFARVNEAFREACDKAGIAPSSRQAGKFRRKTGVAWFSLNQ